MSCDCAKTVQVNLTEKFKAGRPDASGHQVELQGYGFALNFESGAVHLKGYMPYKYSANFPLKKGGKRWSTKTGRMIFSFCPWCGEKMPETATKADSPAGESR